MSSVVVMRGKIECKANPPTNLTHGGQASFPQGSPKLTVRGVGVIVSGMEARISFAATCPCKVGNSPSPCTAARPATSGISTKILVNGQGVLLDTARGQTLNPGDSAATWEVAEAGQDILRASS
jgi:hypothetical protein